MKIKIFTIVIILSLSIIPVLAQSTYQTVELNTNDNAAISEPVGNGTTSSFYARNTSSYNKDIRADALCAWVGWPYTLESYREVKKGISKSWNETQSKNSTFKIRLWSMNGEGAKGNGSVTLK